MDVTSLSNFGLRPNPFSTNPDPDYLFLPHRTQAALDDMACAIQSRKGLILLTGEPGTGKTTLLYRLMRWLRMQKMPVAFIFNPRLEVNDLFDLILADFGIPSNPRSKGGMLARLNQWLAEGFQRGANPVLIIDEAQGLPVHVLEEIRMLLNQETPREKLLQIVLSAQPEFEEMLRRPGMRQLRQRISLRCHTTPFTRAETDGYIQKRLCIAGKTNQIAFLPEAIEAVHRYSRGIPRVMNLLCEHALTGSSLAKDQPVPAYLVDEAACRLQFDDVRPVGGRQSLQDFLLPVACAADSAASVEAATDPILASILPAASPELPFDMHAGGKRTTMLDGLCPRITVFDSASRELAIFDPKMNDGNLILEREKVSSNSISELEAEPLAKESGGNAHGRNTVASVAVPFLTDLKTLYQRALGLSRMRQLKFEARKAMERLSPGKALQRIIVRLRRWLQQPLPGTNVHRRLER
jgi:general secretion pathway protein A